MDPSPAPLAATDGNIKTSPDRLPHHLVLILRLDFFHFYGAPTRTSRGNRHRNHFVDLLGKGLAVMLAVGGAGLAPWWLRIGFPLTAGKGCGLSLVGPLRFFQLSLQPFVFLAQPFLLSPQLLVFFSQPLIFQTSATPLPLKGGNLLL